MRESERKRLQRGIITAPTNNRKQNNALNGESNNGSTPQNASGSKAEHLLELQEKITREILSTKLAESEMNALQVCFFVFMWSFICHLQQPQNYGDKILT